MAEDIYRGTNSIALPEAVASEIWAATVQSSAVMQLARRVNLPGTGTNIHTIATDAVADWVDETDEKPVSNSTLGSVKMGAYKLAVIETFSNEFRRDMAALYQELVRRLPYSLATKFDQTALGVAGSNPTNFTRLASITNHKGITPNGGKTTYGGLVNVDAAIAAQGGIASGYILSPQARALILGAVDGNGRPMLVADPSRDADGLRLFGAPVVWTPNVYKTTAYSSNTQLGIAGDWSRAVWGSVEGVTVDFNDSTSLVKGYTSHNDSAGVSFLVPDQVNLWQRDMFAVRAEIEVGFRVQDEKFFAAITDANAT